MRLEAREPYADETEGSWTVFQRAVEQGARELPDAVRVVGADRQRGRAAPDREVRVADLRRDCASRLAGAPQVLGERVGHRPQLRAELLDVGDVARERLLLADGNPLRLRIEPARIDPARPIAEQLPDLPRQQRAEPLVGELGEAADRLDPGSAEAGLGARTHPRQAPHVEWREELRLLARPHDDEPAGLALVAGDLGDHLAGRDA